MRPPFTRGRRSITSGSSSRTGKSSTPPASNTRRLNEILDSDDGARFIGEFSLAFNPHILEPMRDILFDEKISGSFHFTPGQAYEQADNGNRSQVHWDMVNIQRPEYGGGAIYFDGKIDSPGRSLRAQGTAKPQPGPPARMTRQSAQLKHHRSGDPGHPGFDAGGAAPPASSETRSGARWRTGRWSRNGSARSGS